MGDPHCVFTEQDMAKRWHFSNTCNHKSIVDDITTNHNNRAISEAIITMAHSLQLKVIAEGVKTVEQLKILRSLGCDEIQGYLFSEPLPAEKLTDILVKGCFANAIPEKADN